MITVDRQKHMFEVANFLKDFAIKEKMKSQDVEDLFTLGLLHDIGYEFLDEKDYSTHPIVGGLMLKKQKYKYWKEVYYHGEANCKYKSKFLDLLNWADMHIDGKGNYVSFEGRMQDIDKRYAGCKNKPDIKPIVDELKAKGFE